MLQTKPLKLISDENISNLLTSSDSIDSPSEKKINKIHDNINVSKFISEHNTDSAEELLKKKRKVKYNMITKRFEVEGEEDNVIIKAQDNKNKKIKIIQKYGKETKTYDLSNPCDCRTFQLDSFLNFKKKTPEQAKENQCIYEETQDITNINMHNFCKDIQAILINPPWKEQGFSIEKLVIIFVK